MDALIKLFVFFVCLFFCRPTYSICSLQLMIHDSLLLLLLCSLVHDSPVVELLLTRLLATGFPETEDDGDFGADLASLLCLIYTEALEVSESRTSHFQQQKKKHINVNGLPSSDMFIVLLLQLCYLVLFCLLLLLCLGSSSSYLCRSDCSIIPLWVRRGTQSQPSSRPPPPPPPSPPR